MEKDPRLAHPNHKAWLNIHGGKQRKGLDYWEPLCPFGQLVNSLTPNDPQSHQEFQMLSKLLHMTCALNLLKNMYGL
jgi:hypothetical protein